jgi:hypothetical protein
MEEIGNYGFFSSGVTSVAIPSSTEKIGEHCFWECKSLCELTLESGYKLKDIGVDCFAGCPLGSVKVPAEFTFEYGWPEGCRIEYFRSSEADKTTRKLNISDYVIDLGKEYEFVEGIGGIVEVELWRKVKTGEKVAVKSYSRGISDDPQTIFLREAEALFSLKHLCIASLQGCCLPSEGHGPRFLAQEL